MGLPDSKAGIIATRRHWPDNPFAAKAEMPAVRKGVIPNRRAPGARANVAPTPTTPEGSGGSDQVCIRRVPRVSQTSRARRRPEPIRRCPVSWASERPRVSVFVQFFRFINQLGCDLGTFGVPLSQWDTPGLQNRFLFRACGYHQIIMNALSHLKRFHTVTF